MVIIIIIGTCSSGLYREVHVHSPNKGLSLSLCISTNGVLMCCGINWDCDING